MQDLISRQAAIEVIDAVMPVDPNKSEYASGIACGAALAMTYVKQLQSADRPQWEWISTNGNNLPRPFQSVLVCNEFGDIEIGYLKEEWFWKKDGTFLILCPVAWMPLPTAYKERSRR